MGSSAVFSPPAVSLFFFGIFLYFTPGVFGKTGTDTGPYDTVRQAPEIPYH